MQVAWRVCVYRLPNHVDPTFQVSKSFTKINEAEIDEALVNQKYHPSLIHNTMGSHFFLSEFTAFNPILECSRQWK